MRVKASSYKIIRFLSGFYKASTGFGGSLQSLGICPSSFAGWLGSLGSHLGFGVRGFGVWGSLFFRVLFGEA